MKEPSNVVVDSVSGFCGAAAKLVVGHPFDTIKVRMQSLEQQSFRTLKGAFYHTIANEGFRSLYRGIAITVPGIFVYNTTLFATFGFVYDRQVSSCHGSPTIQQLAIAGAVAGGITNLFHSPFEYLRCRAQVEQLKSPLLSESFRLLFRRRNVGLLRGLHLTLLREIPANALYFSTYELFIRRYQSHWHNTDSDSSVRVHDVPAHIIALGGGCAGIANWIFVFPIDAIKSRWQTDCLERPKYKSLRDCIYQTYRGGGVSAFWKGISCCLVRAFLANSATFGFVEGARRLVRHIQT
uniref:Mitochondrial carrier protein n=1 Tax=Spongospora subterranea TaxID=70186 RepID=A0A0H5R9K2_9EUKA|eukprot:CRZ10795.1 hypothetical protein [Spongospora subterranea]